MQNLRSLTGTTEIRITRAELIQRLGSKYEFLWHFGKKMCRCRRCKSEKQAEGAYRIYVNGYGDFVLYHRCNDCDYPVRSYVDLCQDLGIRGALHKLWLTKFN